MSDVLKVNIFGQSDKSSKTNTKSINIQKLNNNTIYLPWIEKYRPRKIKDIIRDDVVIKKVDNWIKNKHISNMIITGYPGTGKTSTILCIAHNIYGKHYKEATIELNASDNRGLDTINNSIIHFCRKKVSLPNDLPKLIILDEADNITSKAQYTLINLMDKYKKTTKFAYTCNDSSKLVEGIQSRCIILKYNEVNNKDMEKKLKKICKKEKIPYTEDGIKTILFISQGDIRKAINSLESTFFGFNEVNTENIYKICEKPPENDIADILNLCIKGELRKALDNILVLKTKGYCNNDILLTLFNTLKEFDINDSLKMNLFDITSQSFVKINEGIDTNLQLLNCVCTIFKACNKK